MTEDIGLKISKPEYDAVGASIDFLNFSSTKSTNMVVKTFISTVNSNPYVISHGLGYVPKVFIYQILANYNRKLPFDDSSGMIDFSVTKDDIKIRGTTSGIFRILIFNQEVV